MKKYFVIFLAVILLSVCSGGGTTASAAQTVRAIDILTGPSGGTMEIVGAATIEIFRQAIPGVQFSSVPSTGSAVNAMLINNKEGDVAIITADTVAAAMDGEDPFREALTGLKVMCALYPNTIQLWALPDSGINDFGDLISKRFSHGQPGGGPYQPAINFMSVYGFTPEDVPANGGRITPLAWGESVSALQDRNIDAVFWTTSYPAAAIVNASVARELKLVQFDRAKIDEFVDRFPGWVHITIPAGTYNFQNEDVFTVGTPNLYVVREDLPEEIVYEMTKAIVENYDTLGTAHALLQDLSDENVAQGLVTEVHPGALRYFTERGIPVAK